MSVLLRRLPDFDLKTKLLVMMVSLLVLSGACLFMLHLLSERKLLSQVRDYTEELSKAIEVAQEQPAAEGDAQVALKAYVEKLRQLGVADVTLADATDEVQASTNPGIVGKRLVRGKRRGTEVVIRGFLGEVGSATNQKTSTLTIPIVVQDKRVGYLLITRVLDDFSALSEEAFLNRIMVTLGVFALGIVLSFYLSWSFGGPLRDLTDAARKVAAGDLSVQVSPRGGDEMVGLSRTFNEMVERLRENRRLEERLHFAERSTAMGRLASAVAHEIRNPLNFINLSIDHLRGRMAPAEPGQREDYDRILQNVKAEISRLNRLVGDFLSFGKPMRLDPRPCAVDEVLREVASLVDHKAKDQGIALAVETEAGLPRIVADPELLKTCFLNLLINALDAMPGGGLLDLSIRRGRTEGGAECLVVSVRDTGHGMSAEDARTAFEPYFSTKDTGLGLGLALTHKIVADHGGTITLSSTPGQGTTASIVLPFEPESTQEAGTDADAAPAVAGTH
ncbi:MAG TPA: ATP-binding protein [Vicinamibacteria bacterium]|nr:ATP-binding protein [Vicinamibacteria bacterium]